MLARYDNRGVAQLKRMYPRTIVHIICTHTVFLSPTYHIESHISAEQHEADAWGIRRTVDYHSFQKSTTTSSYRSNISPDRDTQFTANCVTYLKELAEGEVDTCGSMGSL